MKRNKDAMTLPKPIEILLVEDNPGDVRLTREALKEEKICNQLHVAKDGDEAIDFLYRRNGFAEAPRPDIILLDLNLPKKTGQEVLAEIKDNPELRCIPVVILTTSEAEEDILKAYDNHANCYITKPVELQKFMEIVRRIETFWFSIVKLPSLVD